MKMKMFAAGMLLCGMNLGCPMAPPPAEPDSVGGLEDTDGDGFFELTAPEGEEAAGSIELELVNEINREQLSSLIPLDSIPGADVAIDLIDISVSFDVTLTYPRGGESTFMETEKLGAFAIRIEADCPETITAVVTLDAEVVLPFVGTLPLFAETLDPFVLSQGAEFECDKLVRFLATFDDATGQPDVDVSVEDIR